MLNGLVSQQDFHTYVMIKVVFFARLSRVVGTMFAPIDDKMPRLAKPTVTEPNDNSY